MVLFKIPDGKAAAAAKPKQEGQSKKDGKKEAEAEKAPTPEELEKARKDKLKKTIKEGGKRGVEIEGAADMGGLQFFCTSVDVPEGDVDLLIESVRAMNAECDPSEEERKGGSGRIGKMVFSAGLDQMAIVAYVPEAKQAELVCKEWLEKVLSTQPGGKLTSEGADVCT